MLPTFLMCCVWECVREPFFMYTLYTIKTWIQIRARSHARTCTSQIPKKMTVFFPSHILNNIWPSVIWYFFCTQRIKLFRYVSHNYACETFLVSSCAFFCPFLNKQQEGKITNMKKNRKSREMGNTRKYLHSMWKSIWSLCPMDIYMCMYIRVSAKTLHFSVSLGFTEQVYPGMCALAEWSPCAKDGHHDIAGRSCANRVLVQCVQCFANIEETRWTTYTRSKR